MGKTNRNTPQGSKAPDGGRSSGNGGRKQRPSGPLPREVQVSKKLAWLLRHGAEKEGLQLGVGGYVNLADLLANRMLKSAHVTFEEVKQAVAHNEKKRFGLVHVEKESRDGSLESQEPNNATGEIDASTLHDASSESHVGAAAPSRSNTSAVEAVANGQGAAATEEAVANEDTDPRNYLIRANQGHSIKLADTSDLLTPITLTAGNLPAVVVHGTRHEVWPDILDSGGLKPMNRNHVHFAIGVPESLRVKSSQSSVGEEASAEVASLADSDTKTPSVISGMRVSSTVLIYLDLPKALNQGIKFFLSENGVVLTEGDDNGVVSVDLFKRVEEKGGQVLVEQGRVVSELKGYVNMAGKGTGKKNTKPKLNTKDSRVGALNGDDGHDDDDLEQ